MNSSILGSEQEKGSDFYYFYDQNLVISIKICLQTCFTKFWKEKLLKITKQGFHVEKQIFFTFFRNTNEHEY